LITGSQDGKINIWDNSFNKIKEIQAHSDIIRKIIVHNDDFVTCSNDSFIKIFNNEGEMKKEFKEHESFIYAISSMT